MAHPINNEIQDGEYLVKIIGMKRDLANTIKNWLENPSPVVHNGCEALDTYFGEDTYELMASSAMNILLAQKTLTEYHRNEGVEGV